MSGREGNERPGSNPFGGPLGEAMLRRMAAERGGLEFGALRRTMERMLDARQTQVYVADPAAGSVLSPLAYGGPAQPGEGDFLMVVDAQLRSDGGQTPVTLSVDYAVDLRNPAAPAASACVSHAHALASRAVTAEGPAAPPSAAPDGCYQSYLRILTPGSITLLAGPDRHLSAAWCWCGYAVPGELTAAPGAAGTTVLGAFLTLACGESHTTCARYMLPPRVLRQEGATWRYSLTVQKHPAHADTPHAVTLQLPPDATVLDAAPAPTARAAATLSFLVAQAAGATITVSFRTP